MTKIKSQLIPIFLCSVAIIALSLTISCEKEPDQIGLDILPGEDNFVVKTDSVYEILATTVKLDSILSYYPDTAFAVYNKSIMGNYTDPFFGQTQASLLVNFWPDSVTHNFGTNPKIDSLVFFMKYDSVFGDKNTNVEFKIWESNKSLSYKSPYYSNINEAEVKGTLISSSVVKFQDTLLMIKIDDAAFINKLFNTPSSLKTLIEFQEYFKGLYLEIKSTTTPGIFVYVDPWIYSSSAIPKISRLSIRYRNDEKDSLIFNYFMLKKTTRVSKFEHDYTGTPLETVLQDNEVSQKVTYVQGMGGLGTRIRIPGLSKWADEAPVSINKAELVIPVDNSNLNNIPLNTYPKRVSIMAISDDGKLSNIEYGFGQTFIGGVYDAAKNVYTFNLAKHLQRIANSKLRGPVVENTDFIVVADGYLPAQPNTFNKVALDFSQGKGAKLYVIYSKQ